LIEYGQELNMDYESSFAEELPKLKTQREREAVKAAVLRFINEIRKEIISISTKNNNMAVTGEKEVGMEVTTIVQGNENRKSLYLKNIGNVKCVVYGINEDTKGGYPLAPDENVTIHGANAIAMSTVSGVSYVSFLDT
jgi:hypothetical protein